MSLEAFAGFSSAYDSDKVDITSLSDFVELGCGTICVGFFLAVARVLLKQRLMNGLLKLVWPSPSYSLS